MDPINMNNVKLLLLGCGNMGSAMLRGWLKSGLQPSNVTVLDPRPSTFVKELETQGAAVNPDQISQPHVALLAVKPQMIKAVTPTLSRFNNGDTLFVSIAAGIHIGAIQDMLGHNAPVLRAVPNTPAIIGKGITAYVPARSVTASQCTLAETLLSTSGKTVHLSDEKDLDAVTALSGSGPAYVFHMIEAMAAAGEALGLGAEVSMVLAKATVEGAGALANHSDQAVAVLRENVTSPNGTTAAGLAVLMNGPNGLSKLVAATMQAANDRSIEMGSVAKP